MTRLLVVEDEDRLARAIVVGLQDEGYLVDRARALQAELDEIL